VYPSDPVSAPRRPAEASLRLDGRPFGPAVERVEVDGQVLVKVKRAPARPKGIQASYTVPELAALARCSPDTMRRKLRAAGFEPPGRRKTEVILFSRLRALAPALCDSLTRVALSAAEAEAVAKRVTRGG
jgi:hypothetical protein